MVTSSSTLAGYGAVGAGLPPYEIKEIIAVVKAYSSAVGAGEFVSEIFGEEADELRRRGSDGGEFGCNYRSSQKNGMVGFGLLHVMAVVNKVLPQLHLQYWMCWVIWMKFLFALRMSWTENVLTISRPQRS